MKFITDQNLRKLSKWLRILGYDTVFFTGDLNEAFFQKAQDEGRIVLTRKKKLVNKEYPCRVIVIKQTAIINQLIELMEKVSLKLDREKTFKICIICNEDLIIVSKNEVVGAVPEHVYRIHLEFKKCLRCFRIYWSGSHKANTEKIIRLHIQNRSP